MIKVILPIFLFALYWGDNALLVAISNIKKKPTADAMNALVKLFLRDCLQGQTENFLSFFFSKVA